MEKKIITIVLVMTMLCLSLCACNPIGWDEESTTPTASEENTSVNTEGYTMEPVSKLGDADLGYVKDADRIFFVEAGPKYPTVQKGVELFPYPVFEKDGKYGLMDLDFKILLEAKNANVGSCSCAEGRVLFNSYVSIDKDLNVYDDGDHCFTTYCNVYNILDKKAMELVISTGLQDILADCVDGAYVVEAVEEKEKLEDFDFVFDSTNLYGIFIDGELVVEAKYSFADAYANGLAALRGDNGKWAYFNEKGEKVIDFKCEPISEIIWNGIEKTPFRCYEGYLSACVNGKWGVYDTSGEIVVEFKYDGLSQCKGGKIFVKTGTEWKCESIENIIA